MSVLSPTVEAQLEAQLVEVQLEVLDDARYIPLLVLGGISSVLSILGSSALIFITARRLHNGIMQRIVFALSIADLFASVSSLWMPYLIPQSVALGLAGAVGNHQSCTIVGFFFMTAIMTGCSYNAHLSMYYLLVVKRNWKARDFKIPLEIAAHVFAILIPVGLNLVAAVTQSINPSPLINNVCTYSTSPWLCNESEEIDCERSSREMITPIVSVSGAFLMVLSALGFVCTLLVWWTVRTTLMRSNSHTFGGDRNSNQVSDERITTVCTQAILYSLVYLNTFFWPALGMILSSRWVNSSVEIHGKKTETGFYIFQLLYWTLYPLQGFFNFMVYTRLIAKRWRTSDPDRSFIWIYKQVVTSKPDDARLSRSGATN